jgi:hypothetical protein
MKKIKSIIFIAILSSSALFTYATIELPETTVRCKCKHGGCYAGNIISVRSTCAVGDEINCDNFDSNCYFKD